MVNTTHLPVKIASTVPAAGFGVHKATACGRHRALCAVQIYMGRSRVDRRCAQSSTEQMLQVSASGSDADVVLLVGVRGEASSSARRASERVVVPIVVPEGPPAKRAHHRPVDSHGTSKQVHGPLHLALS